MFDLGFVLGPELERLMARTCALRASDAERARFAEIADGMDEAAARNDDITFMRLDRAFNILLCQAARNEYVTNAMSLIQGLSRRFWYSHYREVADLPLCARLHAQFARAIVTRDPALATQACDRLMDYVEDFTRASLEGHWTLLFTGLSRSWNRRAQAIWNRAAMRVDANPHQNNGSFPRILAAVAAASPETKSLGRITWPNVDVRASSS